MPYLVTNVFFQILQTKIGMMRKFAQFGLKHYSTRDPQLYIRSQEIIQRIGDETLCDFSLINDPKSKLESIIVLNNELNQDFFAKCMPLAQNVVLADGGANHFYESDFRDSQKVRAVVGDFDCIKQDVMSYYHEKKIPMEYISTLDDNDLCKALEKCLSQKWNKIFCFGAFGGRMDQTLSGMHYAQKYAKMYPQLQMVLLGQSNMMFHLRRNNKYRIRISDDLISRFGCGIITFGKADYIETTGFKWNLGKDYKYSNIEWGSFISTSNQMIEDQCTIHSSCDIFFVANYSKKIRL